MTVACCQADKPLCGMCFPFPGNKDSGHPSYVLNLVLELPLPSPPLSNAEGSLESSLPSLA